MASAPPRIRLLSFGPLRSVFGPHGETVELQPGDTVAALLARLRQQARLSDSVLACAAVAVNQQYAPASQLLADGDEVAILPPVSGGTAELPTTPQPADPQLLALVHAPIDTAALHRALRANGDGALCIFDGVVRDNTRGRPTLHLDYEAYEEMALRQMQQLRTEAIDHFGVREVGLVHRLGRLAVGETSVWIGVASAHRGPAFEACRFVIDTLKKTVPIWKREQFADGAVWADGEPFPPSLPGIRP